MTRMSTTITLVLIGSTAFIGGLYCLDRFWPDQTEQDQQARQAASSGGGGSTGHYHPWHYGRTSYWYSNRGWSGWAGAAPGRPGAGGSGPAGHATARSGGFGSTGHAVGS